MFFSSGYKHHDGGGENRGEKRQEYGPPVVAHGDRQDKGEHPSEAHRTDANAQRRSRTGQPT
jgi:hypothetical protein